MVVVRACQTSAQLLRRSLVWSLPEGTCTATQPPASRLLSRFASSLCFRPTPTTTPSLSHSFLHRNPTHSQLLIIVRSQLLPTNCFNCARCLLVDQ
jgi:hypothetical protein